MKTVSTLVCLYLLIGSGLIAQTRLETAGSPDFSLTNLNALSIDASTRMYFKNGSYYTGGIATIGTGSNAGRLSFYTQASADRNLLQERMTITNSGNVGIGLQMPTYPFHLKNNGMGFAQESTTGGAVVGFYTSGSSAYVQTHNNVPLYFATNNGSAQMALMTTGRLGIGTLTPVSKLEVKGKTTLTPQIGDDATLELNGTLKVSGNSPAAFVVTATEPNKIIIDHPMTNGNPDAIILITGRYDLAGYPAGYNQVRYDEALQKWKIVPTGYKIQLSYFRDLRLCDGTCQEGVSLPLLQANTYDIGVSFNVLVIDR